MVTRTPVPSTRLKARDSESLRALSSSAAISEEDTKILDEKKYLTDLSNSISTKSSLPTAQNYLDMDAENNHLRLSLLIKFTTNFEQLPCDNQQSLDILETLHRMTFSRFSQTRSESFKFYQMWYLKTVETGFDISMFYNNPQQAAITEMFNIMERVKIGSNQKGTSFYCKKHMTAEAEDLHYDLCTRVFETHFELYGNKIIASKTILNWWLKCLERAAKYPNNHRLFHASACMYTTESGWCKMKELTDEAHVNIVKLLSIPFVFFMKNYSPIVLPTKDGAEVSVKYTLDFLKAGLDLYHRGGKATLKQFQEFWSDCVLTTTITTMGDTKYANFIKDILGKYLAIPNLIDAEVFRQTPHFEKLIELMPIDMMIIFKNQSSICEVITTKFLQSQSGSFQDVLNIAEEHDFIDMISAEFIEDHYKENSPFLPEMGRYLTDRYIASADIFGDCLTGFIKLLPEITQSISHVPSRKSCGPEESVDYRREFILNLLQNGVYKNFFPHTSDGPKSFQDLLNKIKINDTFLSTIFQYFAKTTVTDSHDIYCQQLTSKFLQNHPDDKIQVYHMKVFIRYCSSMVSCIEGEKLCGDDENLVRKIASDCILNVEDETYDELESWFGKELLDSICTSVGMKSRTAQVEILVASTESSDTEILETQDQDNMDVSTDEEEIESMEVSVQTSMQNLMTDDSTEQEDEPPEVETGDLIQEPIISPTNSQSNSSISQDDDQLVKRPVGLPERTHTPDPVKSPKPHSCEEKENMNLTPTRRNNSILKNKILTPSSFNRARVAFSENHLEISQAGDRSLSKVISDEKDTRTAKRRKFNMENGLLNHPNRADNFVKSRDTPGSTPAKTGFISRGLAMFQAATGKSTPSSPRPPMKPLSNIARPLSPNIPVMAPLSPVDEKCVEVTDKHSMTTNITDDLTDSTLYWFIHHVYTGRLTTAEIATLGLKVFKLADLKQAYTTLCKKFDIPVTSFHVTYPLIEEIVRLLQESEERTLQIQKWKFHFSVDFCSGPPVGLNFTSLD